MRRTWIEVVACAALTVAACKGKQDSAAGGSGTATGSGTANGTGTGSGTATGSGAGTASAVPVPPDAPPAAPPDASALSGPPFVDASVLAGVNVVKPEKGKASGTVVGTTIT